MSEMVGPEIVVQRGQPVIVVVTFGDGDPDEVDFTYSRPGSERPYADDGYGQALSKIERVGPGVYRYVISTRGFEAGIGEWCFSGGWGEILPDGHCEAAIRARYQVTESSIP